MSRESFAALGARLLLVDRFRLPAEHVAVISDLDAIRVVSAALEAADHAADYLTGRTR